MQKRKTIPHHNTTAILSLSLSLSLSLQWRSHHHNQKTSHKLKVPHALHPLPFCHLSPTFHHLAPSSSSPPLVPLLSITSPSLSPLQSSQLSNHPSTHQEKKPKQSINMADENKGIVHRYVPAVRLLCAVLIAILLLAGVFTLVVYLIYRPSKPDFTVVGATVFRLSNSSTRPNVLSTSMQFALVSHNPNERSSILYDHLSAYVSYRNQPITPPADLPPLLQDSATAVSMSPVLGGDFVPVSDDVTSGLLTDQAYGVVNLRLVLMGRLRYESGPFKSAWYNMYVRCDLLAGIRKGVDGPVPLIGESKCDVDT